MLYKEDLEELKKSIERDISNSERIIAVNQIFLKTIIAELKTAKPNPNIVDLGDAKVKLRPQGVG